jgi:hypothetical protein
MRLCNRDYSSKNGLIEEKFPRTMLNHTMLRIFIRSSMFISDFLALIFLVELKQAMQVRTGLSIANSNMFTMLCPFLYNDEIAH